MSSCLNVEQNNYDTEFFDNSVFSKINNKSKKNIISKNNDVNDNHNNEINIEYNLNTHIFNPTKNSPPNEWQFRLLKRINSLQFID